MSGIVNFIFSVAEGNRIRDALRGVGQFALMRRFPHTWFFPVEDESLYGPVWEGDASMVLNTDECETIVDALFAESKRLFLAGFETMSDDCSALAWGIERAARSVRMANLAASLARLAGDGESGDAPTRNPSPDEAAPNEPEREAETVSNAGEASDGFDFFLSDSPFPEDAPEDSLPVADGHGGTEWKSVGEIEERREAAQGIYAGEPPEPQTEDRSDVYFRLLGGGDWNETPCAGDYGLSDCLAEPSEATLDFADAFFVRSQAVE